MELDWGRRILSQTIFISKPEPKPTSPERSGPTICNADHTVLIIELVRAHVLGILYFFQSLTNCTAVMFRTRDTNFLTAEEKWVKKQ
jgi:hypothetical protein